MSYRLSCDGGSGDKFCPADFFVESRYGRDPAEYGWVRLPNGDDLCPGCAADRERRLARQRERRRENRAAPVPAKV